jgi:hypothetical protein
MKFSIVATALLAQGIAAMPWTSVKSQSNGEEITYALFQQPHNSHPRHLTSFPMYGLLTRPSLRIQVSGASGSKFTPEPRGAINYKNYDVCLKVCWPEEPKCPEGWVSNA